MWGSHNLSFVAQTWIEAIEEGYVGVKEFATKKNVNDDIIAPESYPKLSTFPLHHAIRKTSDPEIAKLLLSLGAEPDTSDSIGDTPLMRALEVNNKMIIERLLKGMHSHSTALCWAKVLQCVTQIILFTHLE